MRTTGKTDMSTVKWVIAASIFLALQAANLQADEIWLTDVAAATKMAKEQDKDLLLLFTGSDWCPPCKKLEEEVFSKPDFLQEAQQQFVFVVFDFPKEKELPAKLAEQNKNWAKRFGIEGYPTVVLADQEQRPFGITGYRDGGVEGYLGELGEFRQKRQRRDEAFAAAAELMGAERAKKLDEGLSEMEQSLAELYYDDIVKEIVEIDKEDISGLRTKWNASKDSEMRKIVITDIVMISRLEKPPIAIAFIDEILNEMKFTASQRLQILQIKLSLLRKSNQLEAMDALLDEMIAMPELIDDSKQRLMVKKFLLMAGTDRRDAAMQLLESAIVQAGGRATHLWLAKGQLLFTEKKYEDAIKAFDSGITNGDPSPDLLIDLYGAKADCYMAMNNELRAIQTLDKFAEDESWPSDLRAEALLQKAMIMRDSGRKRRATLVENRAIELSNSPTEQAEIRKLVDRLRRKYGGAVD